MEDVRQMLYEQWWSIWHRCFSTINFPQSRFDALYFPLSLSEMIELHVDYNVCLCVLHRTKI